MNWLAILASSVFGGLAVALIGWLGRSLAEARTERPVARGLAKSSLDNLLEQAMDAYRHKDYTASVIIGAAELEHRLAAQVSGAQPGESLDDLLVKVVASGRLPVDVEQEVRAIWRIRNDAAHDLDREPVSRDTARQTLASLKSVLDQLKQTCN
jgi:hypothetical protein